MKAAFSTPDENLWLTRINRALEWRALHSFESDWPTIDRIYAHKHENKNVPRFNLIYMMGQTLIPNLVFQSPGILNTPERDDMVFMASLWDSIDNAWIQQCEMKEITEQAVLSSYLHNTTAVQIGYDFDTEADKLRNDMDNFFESLDNNPDRTRRENMPWLDLVPSHRFVVGVGTTTMRICPWAAKLVSVPTKILKGKPGLKNVRSTKLPDAISRHETDIWSKKDPDKWTHFWQIHDSESKKFCWLNTDGKYILAPTEDPLQVRGLPFETISFNMGGNNIYGTPDAEYILSQHMEGEEARLHSMYMRRFAMPKMLVDTKVFPSKEVDKMLQATVSPAIYGELGEGGEDDIRKHVYVFTPPTSLMLNLEYCKALEKDAQSISGFGPNQMGNYASGRRTKAEAQIVEGASTARLASRRVKVADMIKGHVQRANILIARNWTGTMVQQVVGVDGALYWVKANPDQIRGMEHGISTTVNVESLAPVSRERRKSEAANLLGMLGNMQNAGMNTMPLIKQLLSCYEWIDVSRVLPQMSGEYELAAWEELQRKKLQDGGMGGQAANNMQGVQSLSAKLPSEVDMNPGEQINEDRENNNQYT